MENSTRKFLKAIYSLLTGIASLILAYAWFGWRGFIVLFLFAVSLAAELGFKKDK